MVLFVSFVQESRFEMSQSRTGVYFDGFFITLESAIIIQRTVAALAGQIMRFFFLIQLAAARRQTSTQSQRENQEDDRDEARQLNLHRATLCNLWTLFNGVCAPAIRLEI